MKYFKFFLIVAMMLVMVISIAACGTTGYIPDTDGNNDNNGENETPDTGGNTGENETPDTSGDGGNDDTPPVGEKTNILVVYFSCTNTTKGRAETLQERLNADIYRINPADPYTSADLNYSNTSCRANQEQSDENCRPEISGSVENMEQYDVVYIGYPIWWGQAPKIIYTFLESYDFNGVTIIPFCTSGGSSMGTSGTNLHSSAPNAIWKSGCLVRSANDIDTLVNMK